MLPTQYLTCRRVYEVEPHKRLMAAVLQTVVDDCRGSAYRRARNYEKPIGHRDLHRASVYLTSTDRVWPFSFENLCDALGVDAARMRTELKSAADPRLDRVTIRRSAPADRAISSA
jgi:hypothetical protein